ncbi:MAG: tRNA (guanosine(37)-N1)-methyltransferase TrmD [Thermoanaerobaculia bacterium]
MSEHPREPRPANGPLLRIDVATIFPKMFDAILSEGIIAKAVQDGTLALRVWDLRDFTSDRHRSTDDEAYGGGHGMVMLPEPLFRCVDAIRADGTEGVEPHVVMMSPQGRVFSQDAARELSTRTWVVVLCGRYEGIDERVREALVDEEISIGDYVVTGGELPAMVVIDATGRMVDGVVGERNSVEEDSFYNGLLDHPHYTRPAEFRGLKVPDALLSGNHERIRKWRKEQALRATLAKRPDLLETATLDEEAREILGAIRSGRDPNERKRPRSR